MQPFERVQAAFEHRPTDKVPIYQAGFSSYAGSIVLGREAYVGGGIQQYREARALWEGPDSHAEYLQRSREDAFDIADVLDLDLIRPMYWRMNEKPTRRIDEFTFFYGSEESTWRIMQFNPQTELYQVASRSPVPEPSLDDLERNVAASEAREDSYNPTPDNWPDLVAAIERFGGKRAIPGFGVGLCIPRERVWLEATVLRPELVGRYLDQSIRHHPKTIAVLKQMGLTYLCGGGDFAGPLGPMYSPRVFHDLMAPRLQRISEMCHAQGCYHGFASDGNLWPVADDLFGTSGVDFFYEVDRQAGMELGRLRQTFPHLTLWGGINSATLHRGTVEEVRVETVTALEAAQAHTSIVVGCSNQIVAGTPPENIEMMLNTLRDHR